MAVVTISVNGANAVAQIGSVQQAMTSLGHTINKISIGVKEQATAFESLSRQYLFFLQARVFFGVLGEIKSVTEEAHKLARQITEIRTISQDLAKTTQSWTKDILGISTKLGVGANDVAAATYQALSNNVQGARENLNAFITTSAQFAQVTQTSTKGAVDLLSSAINSFGKSAADADQISAVLFNTIERGRVRSEAIQNVFGRVAVQAHAMNLTLEETAAAITVLSVKGLKESEVITQLTSLFTAFQKPTKELTQTFLALGFASPAAALQSQGLIKTIEILKRETRNLTPAVAAEFANKRAISGFFGIDTELLKKEFAIISNPEPYKSALKIVQSEVSNQLDVAKEKIKATFLEIGLTVLSGLNAIVKGLNFFGITVEGATAILVAAAGAAGFGLFVNVLGRMLIGLGLTTAATKIQTVAIGEQTLAVGTFSAVTIRGAGPAAARLVATELQTAAIEKQILAANTLNASNIRAAVSGTTAPAAAGTAGTAVALGAGGAALLAGIAIATFAVALPLFKQTSAELAILEAREQAALRSAKELGEAAAIAAEKARPLSDRAGNANEGLLAKQLLAINNALADLAPAAAQSFDTVKARIVSTLDVARDKIKEFNSQIQDTRRNILSAAKSIGEFRAGSDKGIIEFKLQFAAPGQRQALLETLIDEEISRAKKLAAEAGQLTGVDSDSKFKESTAALNEARKLFQQQQSELVALRGGGAVDTTAIEEGFASLNNLQARLANQQRANQRAQIGAAGIPGSLEDKKQIAEQEFLIEKLKGDRLLKVLEDSKSAVQDFNKFRQDAAKIGIAITDAEIAKLIERNELLKGQSQNVEAQRTNSVNVEELKNAQQKLTNLTKEAEARTKLLAIQKQLDTAVLAARQGLDDDTTEASVVRLRAALKLREMANADPEANFGKDLPNLNELLSAIRQSGLDRDTTTGASISNALNGLKELALFNIEFEQTTARVQAARDALNKQTVVLAGSPEAARAALEASTAPAQVLATSSAETAVSTKAIADNMRDTVKSMERLRELQNITGAAPREFAGGNVFRYAGGGNVGGFGPDNIPIMAHAGEQMMTTRAVQLFGSQLREIAIASRLSTSNNTTTNSGDTHIHVEGVGQPEQVARSVWAIIQRDRRRGLA